MIDLITILGPTASGKTSLAVALARQLDTEIISADSRQLYRQMDIGTGKDLNEYTIDEKQIPHHLIDICDAGYKYNLFEYQEDFFKAYHSVKQKGKLPVLCGGTGLYIESVLKGYNLVSVPENPELRARLQDKSLPELEAILSNYKTLHNTTDTDTCKRAIRAIEIEEYCQTQEPQKQAREPLNSLIIGVSIELELRRKKISDRLRTRLREGMIGEVEALLKQGIPAENLIYYGLEYKYITEYITGILSYEQMLSGLEVAIHQFAKRQMTWFRGMERRGFSIHWLDATLSTSEKLNRINEWIAIY